MFLLLSSNSILLLGQCQPCLADLKYTNSILAFNTMHFLEMAFVGWETENWDRGGEKHTDKIIKQLGRIFLFYLYKIK